MEPRIFKIDIGSYKTIETARLFLLSENEKSKHVILVILDSKVTDAKITLSLTKNRPF